MTERKIVTLLSLLADEELDRFGDYLNSPYFNKNKEIKAIYENLHKFLLESKKTNHENFDNYLKKNTNLGTLVFSKDSLNKYFSKINQLLMDFLTEEQLRKNKFTRSNALVKYFSENNMLNYFDSTYKKLENGIKGQKLSMKVYKYVCELEEIKSEYLASQKLNRIDRGNIRYYDQSLDRYYLTQKLYNAIAEITVRRVSDETFEFEIINEFDGIINRNKFKEDPLIGSLYYAWNMLSKKDEIERKENFDKLLRSLNTHSSILDSDISYNLNIILQNNVRIFYKDDNIFYPFIFQHYKNQIKNKTIYYKDCIFASVFKNIVVAGTINKELEWTENFIQTHRDKIIPESLGEDITNYCLSMLSFFKGDYKKTQAFISNLHFKDLYYKMAVKRMELMVYFELKEYIYLESLIKSFRVTLTPERSEFLAAKHREANKTFATQFLKVLKYYNGSNEKNVEKLENLKKEIIAGQQNVGKSWLLQKVNHLIDNN